MIIKLVRSNTQIKYKTKMKTRKTIKLYVCMLRIQVSINIKSIYICNKYAYRFSRRHITRKRIPSGTHSVAELIDSCFINAFVFAYFD